LTGVGSLTTFELRIVNGTTIGSRHGIDKDSIGPSSIKVGIPGIRSSSLGGRDGRRSGEHGKTHSGRLTGILSLTAFEFGIVNDGAIRSRQGVDTVSCGVVDIRSLVVRINSSGLGWRDCRRSREHRKTHSSRLTGILSLTTLEFSIINNNTIRSRQGVDTISRSIIHIRSLVIRINSTGSRRRDGGRSGKVGNTGPGSLGSILALAAVKLSIVDGTAIGSRHGILTDTIGKVDIVIGIPGVRSSRGSGGSGRRSGEHAIALAGSLLGKDRIAAGEFGGVTGASLGVVVVGGTPCCVVVARVSWIIQHGEIALSAKSCGRAIANGESDEADLEYSHDDQCVFRWDGQVWEVERVD
jgi:hypothetical protein